MKKEPKRKVAPSPAPSSSVKRAVPSARKGQPYRVQVSSFRKLNSARVMKSDLRKKGYPAFIVSVQISKGKGIWYRVYLGEYPTEERARAAANQARRRHKLRPIVLKVAKK
ncbi:MAG: hypothetical protein GWN57_23865 [Nitrospinaceae bacterium]|nr:hypothetical protein [Nitrospinaceae bacterium]NIW61632.1 hypothetical protein [Nitrospinaceae bacterium]